MCNSKLSAMLERKKITQAQLSRLLNISRASVCTAVEKGLRNSRAAQRYAKALNCNPLDLIEL